MTTPARPSPLSFETGRQSPFQRHNSTAQTTMRVGTPTSSPTKVANTSSVKSGSLSPEKISPFVRRPSQMSQNSDRPSSPFGRRPTSALGVPTSPSSQDGQINRSIDEDVVDTLAHTRLATGSTTSTAPKAITPSPKASLSSLDGPTPDSPATAILDRSSVRPAVAHSTPTSSKTSSTRIHGIGFTTPKAAPKLSNAVGGYSHVPQPLLRSMRESFEVLDSSNSGAITSASVSSMLEQIGLDASAAHVRDFFPTNGPAQLNLARYLDVLSGPLADLGHMDELTAAFEAFDVDDSGQIDIGELRAALLHTASEPGEAMPRLSERELDSVLGEFAARRAFGGKGLNVAKSKGDVFRYRDFMANLTGGGGGALSDQTETVLVHDAVPRWCQG